MLLFDNLSNKYLEKTICEEKKGNYSQGMYNKLIDVHNHQIPIGHKNSKVAIKILCYERKVQ